MGNSLKNPTADNEISSENAFKVYIDYPFIVKTIKIYLSFTTP